MARNCWQWYCFCRFAKYWSSRGLSASTLATIGAYSAALSGAIFESAATRKEDKIFGAEANMEKKNTQRNQGKKHSVQELQQWFRDELKFRNEKDRDKYVRMFAEHGFDTLDVIKDITEKDLKEMGVKILHRRRILKKVKKLKRESSTFEYVESVASDKWKEMKRTLHRNNWI